MGGIVGKIFNSPIFSFIAPFIPVIGPFLAMAQKLYQTYEAIKSGNFLGAGMSIMGMGGVGGALGQTMSGYLDKAEGWVGSAGLNFAHSMGMTGAFSSTDLANVAGFAGRAITSSPEQAVADLVRANARAMISKAWAQHITQSAPQVISQNFTVSDVALG